MHYLLAIPLTQLSIAAFASEFGTSKRLTTKLSTISATPIDLGLTAKTSGFGNTFPKQQIIFLASLIASDISPTSKLEVCA